MINSYKIRKKYLSNQLNILSLIFSTHNNYENQNQHVIARVGSKFINFNGYHDFSSI